MIAKIILWVVIIGAVAFGGHAVLKKDAANTDTSVMEEQTGANEEKNVDESKKMAFSAFLKSDKGAYKCTVNMAMNDFENSGTVYVNNGNIRGDFKTVAEGRPVDSSILMKDGYQYFWSSQMQGGVKMAVNPVTGANAQAQSSGTYSWNAEQIGDYDCDPWAYDAATFSLPKGVVFTDMSAMLKTGVPTQQ